MTKIMKCSCKHKEQDKMYGEGMRVHNSLKDVTKGYRCTVCQNVKK
jgi:hypothetical protein